MSVTLACTCRQARDLDELPAKLPVLESVYRSVTLLVPPAGRLDASRKLNGQPSVRTLVARRGAPGSYQLLERALDGSATHVHYCDLGHLLRWISGSRTEWKRAVQAIEQTECLVLGRTESAFQTYHQAAQETERVVNAVFSRLLRQPIDLCSGALGVSRGAAAHVIDRSPPDGLDDAVWPLLLYRAGFAVDFTAVDGLRGDPTGPVRGPSAPWRALHAHAATCGPEPRQWVRRVRLALEIVQDGLIALQQPLDVDVPLTATGSQKGSLIAPSYVPLTVR